MKKPAGGGPAGEASTQVVREWLSQGLAIVDGAVGAARPLSHCQPLLSISRTAALFLAPICSADTLSDMNVPKRFRIGLLP